MHVETNDNFAGDGKDELRREEDAYRRFGTRHPKCSHLGCDVTDWKVLTGDSPESLLCYEHRRMAQGYSPDEDHHPAGRSNDPRLVIRMPGNIHRSLDERKRDWPQRTVRNPEKSPLLRAAAHARTTRDWLHFIIENFLVWVPEFLEGLDAVLTAEHGPKWWEALRLGDHFAPRR